MAIDRKQTIIRPPTEIRDQWESHADDMDYSTLSGFIIEMVEAGRKKFDRYSIDPDTTAVELREQRNNLRDELDRQTERVRELEDRLDNNERATVRQFVEAEPGSTFAEILQHSINYAPRRINHHLDELEGDSIRYDPDSDSWYPLDAESGSEYTTSESSESERGW